MHLTRAKTTRKIPIPRKGTRYLARALNNSREGVPVVVAIRDMLKLAKTSREVKQMLKEGIIKINGAKTSELNESIKIFNVLEAGKKYVLTLLPTGRYSFEETKGDLRHCKVIGKKILSKGRVQINLHDGSNFISKDKINVGDSVELNFNSKSKKIISLEKGKEVFIFSGRSIGHRGKILNIHEGKAKIKIGEREVDIDSRRVLAI